MKYTEMVETCLLYDIVTMLPGVSKKMNDSEIILLGAFRDCFLLTMILGTLI